MLALGKCRLIGDDADGFDFHRARQFQKNKLAKASKTSKEESRARKAIRQAIVKVKCLMGFQNFDFEMLA